MTVAGILGLALSSILLLCGAGLTPTGNVQTADINANGFSLTNAATVSAANFVGNGAGLTNVASTLFLINGTQYAAANISIVGSLPTTISFSGEGVQRIDFTGLTALNPSQTYTFDGVTHFTSLSTYLALANQASGIGSSFNGCGLTSDPGFVAAFNAISGATAGGITGLSLSANNNPLHGAIGTITNPTQAESTLSLSNCGITSVSLGSITDAAVELSGNAIPALDFTNGGGGSVDFDGVVLNLASNPLATITPGNGTTTGITSLVGGNLSFNGCALNAANEDGLLGAFVALETASPGNNATIDLSGGTNAAPDATGSSDIATLVGTGWTVTHN